MFAPQNIFISLQIIAYSGEAAKVGSPPKPETKIIIF